jgi:hypothetical protein
VRARTAAINELKVLVVTAADELRRELRGDVRPWIHYVQAAKPTSAP